MSAATNFLHDGVPLLLLGAASTRLAETLPPKLTDSVPLLVIGLFSGCRYSFIGQDFDKAVEYIKKTAAEA